MAKNGFCLMATANIVSALVVLFSIISFATDYWIDFDVDRTQLDDIERTLSESSTDLGKVSYSRHRGLMRECYSSDAAFLAVASDVVDDDCFYIDFDDVSGSSDNYRHRMHLLRAMLGLFIVGMVAAILTFFVGIFLCFSMTPLVASAAGILTLSSSILMLLTVVFFHVVEYLENNEEGNFGELAFRNVWSNNLRKATDSDLDYSYALAWVAIILAGFDGVLYLLTALSLRKGGSESKSVSSDKQSVIYGKAKKFKTPKMEPEYFTYDNQAHMMAPAMYNPGFVAAYPADMGAMTGSYQIPFNPVYALPGPAALSNSNVGE